MIDKYADEREYLAHVEAFIDSELSACGGGMASDAAKLAEERKYMWQDMPTLAVTWEAASDLAAQNAVLREHENRWAEKDLHAAVLQKMKPSPYFGRVDFIEDGAADGDKFYIGLSNLMDKSDYRMLVCDWRAPVASLFYDNGRGRTSYLCPDGRISGEVSLLRQYRIGDGELKFVIDSDIRLDDTILQDALASTSNEHMRTIVSSIQKEQNSVIRDSENDLLIVLGPAGSGKTSIALHRIAYLLYRDRNTLTSDNILIFSPNDVFCGYISQVIPELGEPSVRQTTFSDLITQYCSVPVRGMFEQSEFLHAPDDKARFDCIRFKSSPEFVALAHEFVDSYIPKFTDVTFGGKLILSAAAIKKIYTETLDGMPLTPRLTKLYDIIFRRFGPAEQEFRRALKDEVAAESFDEWQFRTTFRRKYDASMADTYAQIRQNTALDYLSLYRSFLYFAVPQWSDASADKAGMLRTAGNVSPDGSLFFEDGVGLLLLTSLAGAIPAPKKMRHIVLDEVQDYTAAQHEILSRLFAGCSFTMLGDTGQLINPYAGLTDPGKTAGIYGIERYSVKLLTKSYRSTTEINLFAEKVLPEPAGVEYFERHGKPVCEETLPDEAALIDALKIAAVCPSGSTAILTKTVAEAKLLYQMLHPYVPALRLLISDDVDYRLGLWIMPVALAKGLEFDRVIVADSSKYACEQDRGLLYVACTRAMHELTVFSLGAPSPLIRRD